MKQVLEYLQSFVVIALVLAGIGGLSFHLFREEGWVETILGNVWEIQVQYPLIAIPVTIGAIILGKMWRDNRIARGSVGKLPDIVIYALMAAGVYFIGYFAINGSL